MLVNFKDNGKWGYYNSKSKKTIPAQFRDDSGFVDGFAIVKQCSNSLYGVIDEEGKEILLFLFDLIERQDNGLFKAGSYYFNCLYNQKGEIVDDDGTALEDRFQKYDVVKAFGNDLYIFKKESTKGVIYKDKIIIEKDDPYHDYIEITPYLHFFRLKDSQGNYRYYNYDGLQIFSETYEIQLISDEYVVFYAGYNKGYGIANAIGEILLPAKYNEITHVGGDVFLLNYKKEQKDDDLLVKYNVKLNCFIVKDDEKEIAIPKSVDWCGDFEEGKALIATNYKYGILDVNSNICVPCNYDEIRLGHGNVVVVKEQDKYKLLDWVNGEIKAVFDEIKHLRDSYFVFKEKWNYGVIDNDGIKIIPAHYQRDIELLEDGNFRISKGYDKNSYCIIDKDSHIIIMTSKGLIRLPEEIIWANNFSEGLAIVEDSKGLYGAIDEQGKIAIPCQFNALSNFKNGFSYHYVNRYEKEKIDKLGKVILEDDKALLSDGLYESVKKLCDNRYLVQCKDNHFYAIVDRKNKIIVHFSQHQYYAVKKNEFGDDSDENVLYFSDDYRKVDALFYAKSGARIIPGPESCVIINPEYRKTRSHFSDGMAAVSNQDGLWGFVDESGIEVIPCIYDEVHDFNDGYCVVRDGNNLCLIDKKGKLILSGVFRNIRVCEDDMFIVTHDWFSHDIAYETTDGYGLPTTEHETIYDERKFNKNGEIVIPFRNELIAIPREYEWCDDSFHEGFLSVYKNGMWGVINLRLEQIIECLYGEKIRFDNGIAIVEKGSFFSVVDTFGHSLIPNGYININRHEEYNLLVCQSSQGYYDIYNGIGGLLFSTNAISSRILISETTKMSSNRFRPSEIIPLDKNYLGFSVYAKYENRHVKKWGICGIDGSVVLEACLDEIGGIGSGLVSAAKIITHNCKRKKLWGYVDIRGNIVIEYKYAYAKPFSHGIAQVSYKDSMYYIGGLGLIATDGKELTDFVYEKFEVYGKGEMLAFYQYNNDSPVRITEQGAIHYEYYEDETCKDVYLYGYDWCSEVYHGLCIVMKGLRYGIIEASGVTSFPLSEMGNVKIAVNPDGFVAFYKCETFKDVTKEGRIITYLNDKRIELPIGIHWCDEWNDGYIAVESNGKWGLLNKELEFVVGTKYDNVQYIGDKHVLCCDKDNEDKKYTIYDIGTGEYSSLSYNFCSRFEKGFAIVSNVIDEIKLPFTNKIHRNYAYGLIDNTGKELLPCIYSKIQFEEPAKIDNNSHDDYEEPYEWESDYRDAFEDEPGATWGRVW